MFLSFHTMNDASCYPPDVPGAWMGESSNVLKGRAPYQFQEGGICHSEGPRLCPHCSSRAVCSAGQTLGANTASPSWQNGSKRPSRPGRQAHWLKRSTSGGRARKTPNVGHPHRRKRGEIKRFPFNKQTPPLPQTGRRFVEAPQRFHQNINLLMQREKDENGFTFSCLDPSFMLKDEDVSQFIWSCKIYS